MFSHLDGLYVFASNDCSLIKMASFCLNLNLTLSLCVAVFLQTMITLFANSLRIKILLGRFLVHLPVHFNVFYGLQDIVQ